MSDLQHPSTQDFTGSERALVAYWAFDGDHRNRVGDTGHAAGVLDEYSASLYEGSEALFFNGLAKLDVEDNAALHGCADEGFSLEAMIYPRSRSQRGAVVVRRGRDEATEERGFELVLDRMKLCFRLLAGDRRLAVAAPLPTDWHYVAATLHRREEESEHLAVARLWIDGELAEEQVERGATPLDFRVEPANHTIGGRRRSDFLYGDLDFLRHWDRPLGSEEIIRYARPGITTKRLKRANLGAY